MSTSLGQKIRYFRKRAGLSQMELELEIGASNGSLSRIESGETNPMKETLEKISRTLGLTLKEINYLDGPLSNLPSIEENNEAIFEAQDYFKKRGVLAYIIDDRWRFVSTSDTFAKIFKFSKEDRDKVIGKTIIDVLLDEDLKVKKFFPENEYADLLYYQLLRYYLEVGFMEDDETFKHSLQLINNSPLANDIWNTVKTKGKISEAYEVNKKIINLNLFGIKLPLYLTRESLHKYPRFEIIEFFPMNILTKSLSKLL